MIVILGGEMVAEVIIDTSVKSLNKTFDYEIPTDLSDKVIVGSRVFVPFGNQKNLEEGIVVKIKEMSEYKVKEIKGLQKEQIKSEYISLAKWMSYRYFCNIAECLKLMLPPGRTAKDITKRVNEKTVNCFEINKSEDEIREALDNNLIRSEKQKNVLEYLLNNGKSTMSDIQLFNDASLAVVNSLVKKGFVRKEIEKVSRNPFVHKIGVKSVDLELTKEQQLAYNSIKNSGEYLLYGITGSGKTEIYLQLIEKMLKQGKSSIMLVPEISLTPQTIDRFIARFGEEEIAVLHSKLSTGERFDEWNKIKDGKAKIIIGARSAIFAPAQNLGLIVIDEEHDESYQSEASPRYDSIEVAEYLCNKFNIPLVLGSATPSMREFYKAKMGKINLLTLSQRANNSTLPKVEIVDLRDELANGNKMMISYKLQEEIKKNIETKKQTILYFNRRGFSSFLMCQDCGHTFKCDRCDITLTYHKVENKLKCHYCGEEYQIPRECPQCGSKNIKYIGAGTQKLEEQIKEMFPMASTIRMDIDTVSKKNSHEIILDKFRQENINILIGTQMVVKGHHFPNVTLVGAIFADTSLNIGDFRANERTFQTLTQVAGRAGRGNDEGRVIIQTFNPENYAIQYSKTQNYDLFYSTEIGIRKQLKYPPFCDIIAIALTGNNEKNLVTFSKNIHMYLRDRVIKEKFGVLLYSPVQCPIYKIKDKYRMRILIKCLYDDRMHKLLNDMLEKFEKESKKFGSKVIIQVNPNNML
jgi:primosomal protein N' (replication factor Y)